MRTREGVLTHPSEELLEEYALGRINGKLLEGVELHLLTCEQCQDALAETDDYIAVMKRAAAAIRGGSPVGLEPPKQRNWFSVLAIVPKPVWVGALGAAALCIALWIPRTPPAAYESEATLQVTRGVEGDAPAVAARKPFLIRAEVGELPPASAYRIEIAAADGAIVWQATVPRRDSTLSAIVPRKLPPGRYWVRLSDTQGTLLREYGLESR